ncbi:M28 family peptidase [Gemmatimonadota bacterium]
MIQYCEGLMKACRLALLALFIVSPDALVSAQETAAGRAVKTITHEEVYNFVRTLASPEFEGRYTSHEGHRAAAEWVASNFEEWGLIPYDQKEGFLQPYPSPMTLQDGAEMTLLLPDKTDGEGTEPAFREVPLQIESEFLPFLFSASGSGEAEVVFAGWGVSAPELGYDDFANIDVSGKFVLLFRGSPTSDEPRLQEWLSQNRSSFLTTAREKGALGILYVYSREPIAYTGTDYVEGYSPVLVSETVADLLLEEKGTTFSRLKQDLINFQNPISFPLGAKVRYQVRSRHFPDAMSENVIGYVEGSDPGLRSEVFFLFAHLDHAGSHFGRVFPGAHDNASGSAVVMELAKAFAQMPEKPKRSVAFVLFTAEEVGLGPGHFTDDLPQQFTKVDGVFNYDMVGVGDHVSFDLGSLSGEFRELVLEADESLGIVRESESSRRSGRDYPYLYFASGGGHTAYEHYHRSSDTIYRINPEIMANIARLSFLTLYPWVNR